MRMRVLLATCLLVLPLAAQVRAQSAAASAAADAAKPQEPGTVAFVGKLVSIQEVPDPCRNQTVRKGAAQVSCLFGDATYEATYEVVDVLAGSPGWTSQTFFIGDHYGFPDFAEYRHALLFVAKDQEGWYVHRDQGYAVFPTADSSWASCGAFEMDEWMPDMRPIAFAAPLRSVGESSAEGIHEALRHVPIEIDGGQVHCTGGIPVRKLYELVRTGDVMAELKVELPPL